MENFELEKALERFIISVSGWRTVFDAEGEQGKSGTISTENATLAFLACLSFEHFLTERGYTRVLVAQDTRPTGPALIRIANYSFTRLQVRAPRVCSAPEIMAHAAASKTPFIYFSASHNPIGHNGIKFGLESGGVLESPDANQLIKIFYGLVSASDSSLRKKIDFFLEFWKNAKTQTQASFARAKFDFALDESRANAESENEKNLSLKNYFDFTLKTISGETEKGKIQNFCKNFSASIINYKKQIGDFSIVCDFNGSARAHSIDKDFFNYFDINFIPFNETEIAHEIIPEGLSLKPLAEKMQKCALAEVQKLPLFGYMPDCDGDRGNLVFYDRAKGTCNVLKAQEVFAVCVLAELSFAYSLQRTNADAKPLAIVVNCATSLRIHEIARAFAAEVFTAEVGEANVVGLAETLRQKGYCVRILGEGSNGGNITEPAKVRDPLNTVASILKLLVFRDYDNCGVVDGALGKTRYPDLNPFKLWCQLSSNEAKYKANFTLNQVLQSLPKYTTSETQEKNASLTIGQPNQALLKKAYQKIFTEEWQALRTKLNKALNCEFASFKALGTKGQTEFDCTEDFSLSETGGLKILLLNETREALAFLWMRGSKTEPIFRIMVDIKGENENLKEELLLWHNQRLKKAEELSFML